MTWWKAVIAVLLVLGVGGIAFAGLREKPPPSVEVQLGLAKKGPITRTVTGAGKIQAATTVKISSNLSGDLIELNIKEGQLVTRGQVLGKIDKRRFEAAMKQAQAASSAAQADVRGAQVDVDRTAAETARVAVLVEKGMAAKAELERSTADHDTSIARLGGARDRATQAGARVEETQNDLSKTTLLSPIDGTVIELTREVGERVRGSDFSEDVVMTIAALATMEVKIEVGEHEVVYLRPGQKADVSLDAVEGQTFEGTVTEIAHNALVKNPGTEAEVVSFPITVTLDKRPPGALPGLSAEVRISAETHADTVTVPIQAVTVRSEKTLPDYKVTVESTTALTAKRKSETLAKVVFVVDQEKHVHVRRVKTAIASDNELEIVEGLSPGEQIVEGPYRTLAKELKDGDLVKEMENGPGGPAKGRG